MVLRNDENKLNFLVSTQYSIAFPEKGASIVLHKLAYEIAIRGHNVYVFNEPYFPHENIKVIPTKLVEEDNIWKSRFTFEPFTFPPHKTVSIFTQLSLGNHYYTSHNCRWVLNDYSEEHWRTFGEEDLICNFGDFKVPENTKQKKLIVFDYNLDKFKNLNRPKRKGFCYLTQVNKATPSWGEEFLKTITPNDISDWVSKGGFDYLVDVLNDYEYLITFEDKTYLTSIAALCGTKSIVLSKNYPTPVDYRLSNPIQTFGVAYGFDDIGWANKTVNFARENLIELQKRDDKTVDDFVIFWEEKLLGRKIYEPPTS